MPIESFKRKTPKTVNWPIIIHTFHQMQVLVHTDGAGCRATELFKVVAVLLQQVVCSNDVGLRDGMSADNFNRFGVPLPAIIIWQLKYSFQSKLLKILQSNFSIDLS